MGRRASWLAVAVCLLCACGRSPDGVPGEIASVVDNAVEAAGAGDAVALTAMISADYQDGDGRDRRAMAFLLRTLLGRYPGVLAVVPDLRVQPLSGDLATADMTLILAGRDRERPLPAGIDADRLRLRLALRREGREWRVTRAEWDRNPPVVDPAPN